MLTKPKEYALYKGETFVSVGTLRRISKDTGLKISSLQSYGTPSHRRSHKNGMQLIELEDEVHVE